MIFPSEARPKAELFSSLGNWVGNRKKVDKKKRYDDDDDDHHDVFCAPLPICLANFKKVSVFEENFRILSDRFYFLRKRKISGFCYFL